MNPQLARRLNQPISDVADDIDITDIYNYALHQLRMPRASADAYAAWLDADLNDWGPDDATLRDVLNAAHRQWTGTD